MNQIIEIRAYTLKRGSEEQFDRIVQEQSVPLLIAAGVDVVAARASMHSPQAYLLIRSYQDLAERSASQENFYSSAAWVDGPRDALMACIDSYSTVVIDADQSLVAGLRLAA